MHDQQISNKIWNMLSTRSKSNSNRILLPLSVNPKVCKSGFDSSAKNDDFYNSQSKKLPIQKHYWTKEEVL